MFAIIEIGGQQFKVAQNDVLFVNKLALEVDEKVEIDRVLLLCDDNGKISVGAPTVEGAKVEASVIDQVRADKIIVFKKKRRKGYQKKNGHRQYLTKIRIDNVIV